MLAGYVTLISPLKLPSCGSGRGQKELKAHPNGLETRRVPQTISDTQQTANGAGLQLQRSPTGLWLVWLVAWTVWLVICDRASACVENGSVSLLIARLVCRTPDWSCDPMLLLDQYKEDGAPTLAVDLPGGPTNIFPTTLRLSIFFFFFPILPFHMQAQQRDIPRDVSSGSRAGFLSNSQQPSRSLGVPGSFVRNTPMRAITHSLTLFFSQVSGKSRGAKEGERSKPCFASVAGRPRRRLQGA